MLRSSDVRRLAVATLVGLTLASIVTPLQSQQQAENGSTINDPEHPLLRVFRWRSIGPTGQGGRVDDIAVRPDDPLGNGQAQPASPCPRREKRPEDTIHVLGSNADTRVGDGNSRLGALCGRDDK